MRGYSTLLYPVSLWYLGDETDDHHRNPNINDRDHLVGQLTRGGGDGSKVFWNLSKNSCILNDEGKLP